MLNTTCRWMIASVFVTGSVVCIAARASGQEAANSAQASPSAAELTSEVRELAGTVRELQAQVQSLTAQLSELRGKDENGGKTPIVGATSQLGSTESAAAGAGNPYSTFPAAEQAQSLAASTSTGAAASANNRGPQNESLETRVAKLEDNEQLADAKLDDQYQTKVESGSHYRLRLSGMILLNMFENRGAVDNIDFPEIAVAPDPFESAQSFGGSLRQTQIRIQTFGPDLWGAHTSADVDIDFTGGASEAPNGSILSLPRFRTGTIRFDWKNTSIVAGQDFLFFAPLEPTSIASVAVPPLSYSGNLWGWTPQVRIEHRMNLTDHSNLLLEGGILDSLSGDPPYPEPETDRYPSWGEQSGEPAFAGRVAWSDRIWGQSFTIGEGGYFGKQYWALGRNVNGWAATTDLSLPLGSYFTFSGEFYRGAALGGLGGAIGQDVLLSGDFTVASTLVKGLDSMGGWAQLTFKPLAKFQINAAFGQDNPFASELREYANTPPVYDSLLLKNQSEFANFIYQPRSDVMFSVEYRRLKTTTLPSLVTANQINAGLGYIF